MTTETQLVRFDWAIKSLLRDKANFDVLEGFLTALLREDIQVIEILDSESNQPDVDKKFNRVDILVKDQKQQQIIIEIQNHQETGYLERILWGISKLIVDNLELGQDYRHVSKVISISILNFNKPIYCPIKTD
jgi:predicted transposase/invertase (TIGR01784 family)